MSNRLIEIKNEVAKKHHYGYWVDLVAQNDLFTIDRYFTEVTNQYANECSQASLDKASEKAIHFIDTYKAELSEIKLEINDPDNIEIL